MTMAASFATDLQDPRPAVCEAPQTDQTLDRARIATLRRIFSPLLTARRVDEPTEQRVSRAAAG